MSTVHVVVSDGIDDPARPSGGNVYDRRMCHGLAEIGWTVHEHPVRGGWPAPSAADRDGLAALVATVPDDAVVVVDGIIASAAPGVLVPAARRLRLVVLMHMPLGTETADAAISLSRDTATDEQRVLDSAAAVITTSSWTRSWLLDRYRLGGHTFHVAAPGVDRAEAVSGTPTGGELLCVAAVTAHKGHDVLLAALADVADLPWRCRFVGTLNREPAFVERLCRAAAATGIAGRVALTGSMTGVHLDRAYAAADLLVLASRGETYGMVVTEALARGLPVIATAVGGVPEALGQDGRGAAPGLLVPAGDPAALAGALRNWLGDAALRERLRQAARRRRATLEDWSATSSRIAGVLQGVAS